MIITESNAVDITTAEIGEYVKFGRYYGAQINWRIIHKEDINDDGVEDLMLLSDKLLDLKAFDESENSTGTDTSILPKVFDGRERYGSNNWETSNIREWLNSEAKVNWLTMPPINGNRYDNSEGFLHNFTEIEKSKILTVEHKSILSSEEISQKEGGTEAISWVGVDSNYDNAYYKKLKDRVFFLSIKELNDYIYNNSKIADSHEYCLAKPTPEAVRADIAGHGINVNNNHWHWLRTGSNNNISPLRIGINTSSIIGTGGASNGFGIRPALYLDGRSSMVKGTGAIDDAYEVIDYSADGKIKTDGINDYVVVKHNPELKTQDISIMFRMKAKDIGKRHCLVTTWYGYTTELYSDGTYGFGLSGMPNQYYHSSQKLEWNREYFIANTYNSITNEQKIYIDGVLVDTQVVDGTITYQENDIYISGAWDRAGIEIDDVSIWNREASQSEVNKAMNKALSGDETGLKMLLKFDEPTGLYVGDSSGNGNYGYLGNYPERISKDLITGDAMLDFDGSNDYAISDKNLGIYGDAEFTMEAVFRSDAAWNSNYPSIMGNNSVGVSNRGLSLTLREGRPALDFWVNRFRADEALKPNTWYHIAVTKTPGVIGSTSKIYVNGKLVTGKVESVNGVPNIADSPAVLGRLDGTRWFNGKIKYARYWDKALSSSEIKMLSENNANDKGINANVIAKYMITNSDSNKLNDSSDNNNDATIHGAVIKNEYVETKVDATISDNVKIGDMFKVGNYYGSPINWKVINKDEEGVMLFSDKVITLKAFDAKGDLVDGRPAVNRVEYGSNYWMKSNIKFWLNSQNSSVDYGGYQVPSSANLNGGVNGYNLESGFLSGFKDSEIDALKEFKSKVLLSDPDSSTKYGGIESFNFSGAHADVKSDNNYNMANYDIEKSKVALISTEEIKKYAVNDVQGIVTSNLIANLNSTYSDLDNTSRVEYLTRTPNSMNGSRLIAISRLGEMESAGRGKLYRAYDVKWGIRPVIYIKYGTQIEGEGTDVSPYKITSEKTGSYLKAGKKDEAYAEVTSSKVWLPSIEEINKDIYSNSLLGESDYYKAYPTSAAVTDSEVKDIDLTDSSYWKYYLRTPVSENGSEVRIVDNYGSIIKTKADSPDIGIRPMTMIKNDINLNSGTGKKENAYTLSSSISSSLKSKDLDIGDYVTLGNYKSNAILWRVIDNDGFAIKLVSDKILALKKFDNSGDDAGGRGSSDRTSFGANYYATSNINEWLNSESATVSYSHNAPTSGQNAYGSEAGFLYEFTVDERNMLVTTYYKTILSEIDKTQKKFGTYKLAYVEGDPSEVIQNYDGKVLWRKISDDNKYIANSVIDFKAYDASGDSSEIKEREDNGSNSWETSNIREWLNSNEDTVTYTKNPPSAANVRDNKNPYDTSKGFLTMFSNNEMLALSEREYKTVVSSLERNYADGGTEFNSYIPSIRGIADNYSDSYFKYFRDRVVLPSTEEIYKNIYDSSSVNNDYYLAKPLLSVLEQNSEFGLYDAKRYAKYFLRTPYTYDNSSVRVIGNYDINNTYDKAYDSLVGIRPIIFIDEYETLVGRGDKGDPYRVPAKHTSEIILGEYFKKSGVINKVVGIDGNDISLLSTVDMTTMAIHTVAINEEIKGIGTYGKPYELAQSGAAEFDVLSPEDNEIVYNNLNLELNITSIAVGRDTTIKAQINSGTAFDVATVNSVEGFEKVKYSIDLAGKAEVIIGKNTLYLWTEDVAGKKSYKKSISFTKTSNSLAVTGISIDEYNYRIKISPNINDTNLVSKSGYKYEYTLNDGETQIVDWSNNDYISISDLYGNDIYKVEVKITVKPKDGSSDIVITDTKNVNISAKNPLSLDIVEMTETDMTFVITNTVMNKEIPEHKVIVYNAGTNTVVSESSYSTKTRVKVSGLTGGKKYKIGTKTRSTQTGNKENQATIWNEDFLFIVEKIKPTISAFEINYGDDLTTNRDVVLKLIAADNQTNSEELKVQFVINTYIKDKVTGKLTKVNDETSSNAYAFENENWTTNKYGDYRRFYSGFDLGPNKGLKIITVRVMDKAMNVTEISEEITYDTKDNVTPIINKPPVDNNISDNLKENNGKYDESSGTYLTSSNIVVVELDVVNATDVSYSYDGMSWSPWEAITGDKFKRKITLIGDNGIKTIYIKTKNEFDVESENQILYYTLDMTAPVINITTENGAYIAADGKIQLNIEITDNVSKSNYYKIYVENKDGATVQINGGKSELTGKTESKNDIIKEAISGLESGFLIITVEVQDQLGNKTIKTLKIWSK
jgi:hypothetical protein